ncbi:unnamed protein product [Sphagnum jensenii]
MVMVMPAFAQSAWQKLVDDGSTAYKKHDWATAEKLFREALNESLSDKTTTGETHYATSLNDLAMVLESQGKADDAEALYKSAIAEREKADGANSIKLDNRHSQKKFGPEHAAVAIELNNLAVLYRDENRLNESIATYQSVLAIRRKVFGANSEEVAATLNNLSAVYLQKGEDLKALPLLQEALTTMEKTFGPDSSQLIVSLDNLGTVDRHISRYSEAEILYKRALTIAEKHFGSESLEAAQAQENLADVYLEQLKYEAAEPYYLASLATREKKLDNPNVAQAVTNLGLLYREDGKAADALPYLERTVKIYQTPNSGVSDGDLANALNNLARFYREKGDFEKAEPLYKQSLALREKAFGHDNIEVAASMRNYAILLRKMNRKDEAATLITRPWQSKIRLSKINSENEKV